jgi:hypothetical protein
VLVAALFVKEVPLRTGKPSAESGEDAAPVQVVEAV